MRRNSQTRVRENDNAQLVIDTLMSARGSEYISLLADIIGYCNTGIGYDRLMSKVESIRGKELLC